MMGFLSNCARKGVALVVAGRRAAVVLALAVIGVMSAAVSYAQSTGTPFTSTEIPNYAEVFANIVSTIAPVLLLIIGASVLIGVLFFAVRKGMGLFGVRLRGV